MGHSVALVHLLWKCRRFPSTPLGTSTLGAKIANLRLYSGRIIGIKAVLRLQQCRFTTFPRAVLLSSSLWQERAGLYIDDTLFVSLILWPCCRGSFASGLFGRGFTMFFLWSFVITVSTAFQAGLQSVLPRATFPPTSSSLVWDWVIGSTWVQDDKKHFRLLLSYLTRVTHSLWFWMGKALLFCGAVWVMEWNRI